MLSREAGQFAPFGELIELQIASPSNDFSERFHLDIAVTVGELILTAPDAGVVLYMLTKKKRAPHKFRVRLLKFDLRYILTNCEVPIKSKYRYSAQIGDLSIDVLHRLKREVVQSATGIICGKAAFTTTIPGLSTTAKGEIGSGSKTENINETMAAVKPEIPIVEHTPHGWTVGHTGLGDPLQAINNYCLRGSYFVNKVENYDHSCEVRFNPTCNEARLVFQVSVRDGFYVERVDGRGGKYDNQKVIEEMRNRIASLKFEKLCTASSSVGTSEGLVIVQQTLSAHRSPSEEETCARRPLKTQSAAKRCASTRDREIPK